MQSVWGLGKEKVSIHFCIKAGLTSQQGANGIQGSQNKAHICIIVRHKYGETYLSARETERGKVLVFFTPIL